MTSGVENIPYLTCSQKSANDCLFYSMLWTPLDFGNPRCVCVRAGTRLHVHACLCMYTCAYVQMHVKGRNWHLFSSLLFQRGIFTASLIQQECLGRNLQGVSGISIFHVETRGMYHHIQLFMWTLGNPNSGPHTTWQTLY